MKAMFGDRSKSSNDTCSCTSCTEDLDSPSLKRLLAQESKIDKLFKVNQMPLIEKLIKTRALYDDIRNQLLSSSLSISSKSDLKPRLSPALKLSLAKAKRTGNIFQLVDSLDKDDVSGWKKISECCSCCNCHSKARMNKRAQKGRKHAHAGGYATSKSSVLSKSGNGEELRLGRSFKTKNIKSDPCTCACESHVLKELIKLQSRVALKKIRPEQPGATKQPANQDKYNSINKDNHKLTSGKNEKVKDPLHKQKRTNVRPTLYTGDMGEGGGKTALQVNNFTGDMGNTKKKKITQFRLPHTNDMDDYMADVQKVKNENTLSLKKDSHERKPAIKLKDLINFKHKLPTQNSELKQKITTRPKRSKSVLKNIKVSSSTSTISIKKERGTSPLKTGIKRQKNRFRKSSRINVLPDSYINIRKNLKERRALADRYHKIKMKETGSPIISTEKHAFGFLKGKAKETGSHVISKDDYATADSYHKRKAKETANPPKERDIAVGYPKDQGEETANSLISKEERSVAGGYHKNRAKETASPLISKENPSLTGGYFKSKAKETANPLNSKGKRAKADEYTKGKVKEKASPIISEEDRSMPGGYHKGKVKKSASDVLSQDELGIAGGYRHGKGKEIVSPIISKEERVMAVGYTKSKTKEIASPGTLVEKRASVDPKSKANDIAKPLIPKKGRGSGYFKGKVKGSASTLNLKEERTAPGDYPKSKMEETGNPIIQQKDKFSVRSLTDFLQLKKNTGIANAVQKPIIVRHLKDDIPMRFVPTRKLPQEQINTKPELVKKPEPVKKPERAEKPEPVKKPAPVKESEPVKKPKPSMKHEPIKKPVPDKKSKPVKKPVKSISTNTIVKKVSRKNVDTNTFETHIKKSSLSLPPPKKEPHEEIRPENKNAVLIRRDRHVGRHNLKRCFCTLKLKVKDTKSKINKDIKNKFAKSRNTQSVQENILSSTAKKSGSTVVCECPDAYRKITVKSKTILPTHVSNTHSRTSTPLKLTSDSTYPNHITEEKEHKTEPEVRRRVKETQRFKYQNDLVKNHANDVIFCECPNQNKAIKIDHGNAKTHSSDKSKISKENLEVDGRNKKLKHKKSQISNAMGKPKFTLTKRGFRNCVCSFTIGKLEKKKNLPMKVSEETIFPNSSSTNSKTKSKVSKTFQANFLNDHGCECVAVLPDECDPGFCVPGNCNPNKCKEVLIQRESKKIDKPVPIVAQYQKPESTSGFTVRSLQFPRPKKIDSVVVFHKSEVIVQLVDKTKGKTVLGSSSQQVRPSFAIKFLKKHTSSKLFPFKKRSKREKGINTQPLHDHKQKENQRPRKSILMENINHDRRSTLSPQMNRHLLLEVPKDDKHKQSSLSVAVVDKKYKSFKNLKKSIKSNYLRHLKPYEQNACNFKECDPKACLEHENKKRNVRHSSKASGMNTLKARMVSKSSDTRKLETQSKDVYENPEFKKISASQRLNKNSKFSHLPQSSTESYSQKCGVRMSSNFSFNIEFSKGLLTENDIYKNRGLKNKVNNISAYLKEQKYQYHCFQIPYSTTKIKPILKKCLCSTNATGCQSSLYLNPVITADSQVYSFNSVTIAQNKLTSPKRIMLRKKKTDSSREVSPTTNNTKNALSKIKLCQNSKQEQSSSIYSISTFAYTSEKTYIQQSKCQLLRSHHNSIGVTSKETVKFQSEFRYKVKQFRPSRSLMDIFSLEQYKRKYIKRNNLNGSQITKQIFNNGQITGIQPLLKKCYCTMNIQFATQQSTKRKHKLKDYECEPGVCIPYECNPHECQKLIMRRLMRTVSRMSGTERRLRHSSSSTSRMSSSRSRKLQSSLGRSNANSMARHTGVKYQTLPRSPKSQKQAFRVGSVFSFDIEFSKNTTDPHQQQNDYASETVRIPHSRRDRGVGYSRPERYHRESQSMMRQLRDKASSVSPMLQRCFCTLKLQKKGKQQKQRELKSMNQGTATPLKFQVEKPILRTVETGQNTKRRIRPQLLPYECEPNICVPGECDPYACLELIKRRKKHTREHGTDSMGGYLSTSSSMTSRTNKYRNKGLQARRLGAGPIKSRDTAVISKPSLMTITGEPNSSPRQAVRLGSSFNFSIEFYKNNANGSHEERSLPRSSVDRSYVQKVPKYVHAHRNMRESYTQGSGTTTRDIDSQMSIFSRPHSTITSSVLKRCFCTLKLQETAPKQSVTESMLKRCLCKLKSFTSAKKTNSKSRKKQEIKVIPQIETHVVHTQTRKRYPFLEPYECEPGICVPGLCDPYECEKLIRKRNLREKNIGTIRPRTRSTSSSFTSSRTLKARMTQSTFKNPYERHRSPKEIVLKEHRSPAVSGKQAVRIGSSFSFNVEFYKDNNSCYNNQVQPEPGYVSRRRDHATPYYGTRRGHHKRRTRYMETTGNKLHSRESQVDGIKTKDKSFGPMLKRCFCTLKLNKKKPRGKSIKTNKSVHRGPPRKHVKNNKSKHRKPPSKSIKKTKSSHRGTATPATKKVPTYRTRSVMVNKRHKSIPYKLLPYECEPGVCIPGECDPYECARRIKKRVIHRASGTLKTRNRTRSSMIKPHRRYRDSNAQSSFRPEEVHTRGRRPEHRTTVNARPSRQAVKVGSNFSFDLEFYKDKSSNDSSVNSKPIFRYSPYERPRRTISRSTGWQTVSSRNKRGQYNRAVRDTDSQVMATKMRSTMTGVGPFLKRCFCTAQIDKSHKVRSFPGNAQLPNTKVISYRATVAKSPVAKTGTKKAAVKTPPEKNNNAKSKSPKKTNTKSKKTGVGIKKDSLNGTKSKSFHKKSKTYRRKLEPYECEPGVCIPGQCDPYECEKRIKKRMKSKDSSTPSNTSRSVSSSRSYKTHNRKVCADRCPDECPSKSRIIGDGSPSQQVVRIGSNFRFNMEFFKDSSPQDLRSQGYNNVPKIRNIPHAIKGTETKYRSRSISSFDRSSRPRDSYTQSDCVKNHCKGSCARLKRCFCTLKLQKKGKQKPASVKIEPIMKSAGTRTIKTKKDAQPVVAREIGTKTKKHSHFLEPFECEPGVCIPGLCDPYECEKRIKLRHMKTTGTKTTGDSIRSRSVSTFADQRTKGVREKRVGHRRLSTKTLYRAKHSPSSSYSPKSSHHQSVRLGSNMSFHIEFFKDSPCDQNTSPSFYKAPIKTPIKYKSKTSVSTANGVKLQNQGSNKKKPALRHRTSQVGVTTESKASGKGSLFQRCLCALTLQRAETKKSSSRPKRNTIQVTTQDKATATKKKYKPSVVVPRPQNLDPYECEPGVCIPGQCDPYECLERIKKRGVRRTSRTTGTRMSRPSQISVSSAADHFRPGYRSKVTQDSLRKVERIVEEPRFKFLSDGHRQTVRISSNFSFNIEFIKGTSPETFGERAEKVNKAKDICQANNLCMECKKVGTDNRFTRIGRHGTRRDYYRSHDTQSDAVKTENKSSTVAMLKRCFCTAKLHKGQLGRTQHPRSVIVGRVEEVTGRPTFGPMEYWVQYLFPQPYMHNITENNTIRKNVDSKKMCELKRTIKNSHPVTLDTIMSYTTSKFNDIVSRSTIHGKVNEKHCSICQCNFKFNPACRVNMNQKSTCNDNKKCASFIRCSPKFCRNKGLNGEETVLGAKRRNKKISVKTVRQIREVTSDVTMLTNMLCRWKHLFANHTSPPKQNGNNSNKKKNENKQTYVEESEIHKVAHRLKNMFSRQQTGDCQEGNENCVKLICPHCQLDILQCIPKKNKFSLYNRCRNQDVREREYKDSLTFLFKRPKHKSLKNHNVSRPSTICGITKKSKIKGASNKPKSGCHVCNAKKRKRLFFGVRKKASVVKPRKIKPYLFRRTVDKKEVVRHTKSLNHKLRKPRRTKTYICGTGTESQEGDSEVTFMRGARLCENVSKSEDGVFKENWKLTEKKSNRKMPETYKKISDLFHVSESAMDISHLKISKAKYKLSGLLKRTYKNIKTYLGDSMRAWKRSKDAADKSSVGVLPSKSYKLRSQVMGCSKLGKVVFGDTVRSFQNKYIVKRGRLRPQNKVDRSLNPGFSWWLLTLSPRKEPWVSMYYKCARICPRCLGLLLVWRRITDVLLLVLAGVLWCPCVAAMELCKVIMSYCMCNR